MSRSATLPPVSVFMTVRNEEAHLESAVRHILEQDYAGELEVVVAVGPSDDDTEAIAQRLASELDIVIVQNPTGLTPHGLNAAVTASSNDFLVRCDGHAMFPSDYVTRVVETLLETGAANAGGRMITEGTTPLSVAVAHAMSSRIGLGGGAFHTGAEAGPQPTVYLGSFRREPFEAVGGYDEYFQRAQDWELNHRLREAGYVVWFDPTIGVRYHPRSTWTALRKQQFKTGAWRRRVIARYPETGGFRYLAPPVMVALTLLATIAALVGVWFSPWWALGFAAPVGYLVAVTAAALWDGRKLPWSSRWRLPGVVAVIHWAWGLGFLFNRG